MNEGTTKGRKIAGLRKNHDGAYLKVIENVSTDTIDNQMVYSNLVDPRGGRQRIRVGDRFGTNALFEA